MATNYTLNITNDSPQSQSFTIYQNIPTNVGEASAIAWQVINVPGSSQNHALTWSSQYSFMESIVPQLQPDVILTISQSVTADVSAENTALLENVYAPFQLKDVGSNPPGTLSIITEQLPIPSSCAIGLAMEGRAVCAVEAKPNMKTEFTLNDQYFIVPGNFREGEVMFPQETNIGAINFQNSTTMNAFFLPDGSWNIY